MKVLVYYGSVTKIYSCKKVKGMTGVT